MSDSVDVDGPLGAALAAAVRPAAPDAEGEKRACAAFRAARAEGPLATTPRPDDDWRPRLPAARP